MPIRSSPREVGLMLSADLFCCAGGASEGLPERLRSRRRRYRPQPRYPFSFTKPMPWFSHSTAATSFGRRPVQKILSSEYERGFVAYPD